MKTWDIFSWWQQMEAVTSCPQGASVTARKDCDLGGKNGPPSVRGVMGIWLRRFRSLSCCCRRKSSSHPVPVVLVLLCSGIFGLFLVLSPISCSPPCLPAHACASSCPFPFAFCSHTSSRRGHVAETGSSNQLV